MVINLDVWLKEEGEVVLREIGVEKGHTVLDFGCGSGSYTIPVAKIIGQRGKIYALDKDEECLKDLMEKAKSFGLKNIKSLKKSGQVTIDLENDLCDVILLFDVFHDYYFPKEKDRLNLLAEFHRILKLNGSLIVYPKHFESRAKKEIESTNFYLKDEYSRRLIHDNRNFENGKLLKFMKKHTRSS
jgi:ubiquinone/menaquinone biosynthesis C-methylase UbiE